MTRGGAGRRIGWEGGEGVRDKGGSNNAAADEGGASTRMMGEQNGRGGVGRDGETIEGRVGWTRRGGGGHIIA